MSSLTHFVSAILAAKATWTLGDDLDKVFDKFSGDIVQAVQALKESKPSTTPELLALLQALLTSFNDCATYCANSSSSSSLKYPFTRAERQVRDVVGFLYPAIVLPPSASHKPISVDLSKRQGVEIETFGVGPYQMPRLFNGLWQLSSPAWGSGSAESQEAALAGLVEDGLAAADMADHYVRNVLPDRRGVPCGWRVVLTNVPGRATRNSSMGTSAVDFRLRSAKLCTLLPNGVFSDHSIVL